MSLRDTDTGHRVTTAPMLSRENEPEHGSHMDQQAMGSLACALALSDAWWQVPTVPGVPWQPAEPRGTNPAS